MERRVLVGIDAFLNGKVVAFADDIDAPVKAFELQIDFRNLKGQRQFDSRAQSSETAAERCLRNAEACRLLGQSTKDRVHVMPRSWHQRHFGSIAARELGIVK